MWPKPLLCCRKFPGRAKRKMAGKQRRKLRPGRVQSIHEHPQICNKSPQRTAKSEIPFQRSLWHHRPNRSADKQNENLARSEEHTSELQSHHDLVCRLLLEKKKKTPRLRTRITFTRNYI